ncbi:MAG: YbaK/EbsC family protein [Anaerolineales bacterium]|jgi:Ala-tRNA(Pro) deacylase|nr:MAG: YbaK/EbsC family protein [Anaerolineales bacterium]
MMTCRKRLEKLFREEGVKFSVSKHAEVYSAQRVAGALHIPGEQLAKVVMVKANGEMTMLVLPAPYRLDFKKVKKALKTKDVQLATEEEFATHFPDCEVGAMPPFGRLYNLEVYVDRALTTQPEIAFPAGSHREIMQVAYADFERLGEPAVADLSSG